jgi:hypothetical protein
MAPETIAVNLTHQAVDTQLASFCFILFVIFDYMLIKKSKIGSIQLINFSSRKYSRRGS